MSSIEIHKLSRRIAVHDRYALGAAMQALKLNLFKGNDAICEKIARQYLSNPNMKINNLQLDTLKKRMVPYSLVLFENGGIPENILEHAANCTYTITQNKGTNKNVIERKYASIKISKYPSIYLAFKFDPGVIEQIRKLDTPKFDTLTKSWKIRATIRNCEELLKIEFTFSPELEEWYHTHSYKFYPTPQKHIKIKGLQKELRPFQEEGIAYVVSRHNRALIGDDMGLGKTVQGIGWMQYLIKARPALIVCPASLKYNWAKEILLWVENPSIYVLNGSPTSKTPDQIFTKQHLYHQGDKKNKFIIINYDIIPNDFKRKISSEGKKIKTEIKYSKWVDYLKELEIQCVALDEVQYIKNKEAVRTIATLALCKEIPNIVALSGTPIENRPIEFFTLLNLLNPYQFSNKLEYAMRYCNAQHNGFGWDFKGFSNLKELHTIVSQSVMIRRLKEEVLTELPPKIRITVDMEIDNRKEYDKAKADVTAWFRSKGLNSKADSSEKAKALVKINTLLQLSAKGKLRNCIEWINTYLESGKKLVVFATHQATIDMLLKEFGHVIRDKEGIAVEVDGRTSLKVRQQHVEIFQTNDKCRLFLGNLQAAGVGLTLTAASATCSIELGLVPGHHLQAEDRVHRIGQLSDSVFAYYLIARRTIEEDIAQLLSTKHDTLKSTLDGIEISNSDVDMQQHSMLSDIAQRIVF